MMDMMLADKKVQEKQLAAKLLVNQMVFLMETLLVTLTVIKMETLLAFLLVVDHTSHTQEDTHPLPYKCLHQEIRS